MIHIAARINARHDAEGLKLARAQRVACSASDDAFILQCADILLAEAQQLP